MSIARLFRLCHSHPTAHRVKIQTLCSGPDSPVWSNPWLPPQMKVLPSSLGWSYTGLLLPSPFMSKHAPSLLGFSADLEGWHSGMLIWGTNLGFFQECCCVYGLVTCHLCEDPLAGQTQPQDKSPRCLPPQTRSPHPLSFCWSEFCTLYCWGRYGLSLNTTLSKTHPYFM